VIAIHQRHRQTDRQTDDMQSQDRALHYSASRGKNSRRKCEREFFWKTDNQAYVHWFIAHYLLLRRSTSQT